MFCPNSCSAETFQLCVTPRWKFWAKIAGTVNGGANAAVDAGVNGANGGNGLTLPVPAFCDQGVLRERGVEEVPYNEYNGLNGAMSAVWLYMEYINGAVNIPKPARNEVRGKEWGCQATPSRGSQ